MQTYSRHNDDRHDDNAIYGFSLSHDAHADIYLLTKKKEGTVTRWALRVHENSCNWNSERTNKPETMAMLPQRQWSCLELAHTLTHTHLRYEPIYRGAVAIVVRVKSILWKWIWIHIWLKKWMKTRSHQPPMGHYWNLFGFKFTYKWE